MIEKTLDPRIALDFWVRKIAGCERSDLPMTLTPSGSNGDPGAADGRRHWSRTVTDQDLRFLRKAGRGDVQAELVIYATLYRVLLSFYFGPSASVVAVGGLPHGS